MLTGTKHRRRRHQHFVGGFCNLMEIVLIPIEADRSSSRDSVSTLGRRSCSTFPSVSSSRWSVSLDAGRPSDSGTRGSPSPPSCCLAFSARVCFTVREGWMLRRCTLLIGALQVSAGPKGMTDRCSLAITLSRSCSAATRSSSLGSRRTLPVSATGFRRWLDLIVSLGHTKKSLSKSDPRGVPLQYSISPRLA